MMLDVKSFQLQSFLPLPYEEVLAPRLKRAHEKLQSGSGAGGEFTGWVHLPRDYDRMLRTIAQFEEKGVTREQAQVEAFYVNTRKGE